MNPDIQNCWQSLEDKAADQIIMLEIENFLSLGITPVQNKCIILNIGSSLEPDMKSFQDWTGADFYVTTISHTPDIENGIVVELCNNDLANIFDSLIDNLLNRWVNVQTRPDALLEFINWATEYSIFFKKPADRQLSKEKQRGIIAELYFLQTYLLESELTSHISALRSWRGHDRKTHDFSFPNGNVEVKSTISKAPVRVTINNERQLDNVGLSNLFLYVIQFLEADSGESLPTVIAKIRSLLNSNESDLLVFENYLTHAGYSEEDKSEYLDYRVIISSEFMFKVEDDFPKIRALPDGVGNLKYSLDISFCTDYSVTTAEAISHLIGA